MFCGEFQHTIDDKGRIAVPRDFRDELVKSDSGGRVVATLLPDAEFRCIELHPQHEWERRARNIDEMPKFSETTRALKGFYISKARPLSFDSQGRVLLPNFLREEVGLTGREGMFAGYSGTFLLFDPSEYERWAASNTAAIRTPGFLADVTF